MHSPTLRSLQESTISFLHNVWVLKEVTFPARFFSQNWMHRSKIRWEVETTCFKYHNHYQLAAAGEIFHFVVKSVIFSICSFKCTLFCNALLQFKGGNLRLEANCRSSSSKKPIASLVFIDSYYIRTKSMQLRLKISCCFSICKRNH